MSDLKKIRVQHVDRDAKGVEIKTDVDVITDADCITMDDGDLRSGVKKMIDDRIGEVIDGTPEELDTLKEIATELEKNQSGVSTILNKMNSKLEAKDLEGYAKTEDLDEMQYDISLNIQAEFDKKVDKTQITDSYEESYSDTVPSSKALSNALIAFNKDLTKKVDKVEGKGLSTNDYTDEDKNKLNGIDLSKYVRGETFDAAINETLRKSAMNEQHINQVDKKANNALTSVKQVLSRAAANGARIDAVVSKVKEELSKKADKTDIVDFKRCIVISETNYSALSDAEKNRADTLYFLI